MTERVPVLALAALAVALAGCASSRVAPPLPAAPTAPVQSATLQPITPPVEETPAEEKPQEVASLPDASTAVEVARADLLGGWAVTSGGETCQLFMSLTQWTGGYRASTRGCTQPVLASISAWDLSGKQITLKGEGGTTVATLLATTPSTFNGATTEGGAITVAR